MSQRFEGKSLDEALGAAAETFGVERYQLTYHVLLEKRGFLGGVKRIVIEAEINEAAVAPAQPAVAAHSAPLPARRGEGGRRPGEGRRRNDRGGGGRNQRRGRGPRRERYDDD